MALPDDLSLKINQTTPDPLPGSFTSSGERKEALRQEQEKPLVVEHLATPEIPFEVEHLESIAGAEITLPQPVTDDNGQPILDNTVPQQVTITLPLSEEQILRGLKIKLTYSVRWLAEWAKRVLKKVGGKFTYKSK